MTDDDSRDYRYRRRMTDDDDTVLDNASVTSQDGKLHLQDKIIDTWVTSKISCCQT